MTHERWSLSVPIEEVPLAEHAELARQAEQLGYTDAWSLEVDGTDCFSPLALIGSATRLRLGTAIANVYTRGPATLAMSAAGLGRDRPGPLLSGPGSGLAADCRELERRPVSETAQPGARNGRLSAPGLRRRTGGV